MPPEMSKQEAIQMMTRCLHEIEGLRGEITVLRPKAEAYDNIAAVLRLLPQPTRGYGEDLTWVLKKRIKEIETSEKKDASEGTP